jgi:hypothetical protein
VDEGVTSNANKNAYKNIGMLQSFVPNSLESYQSHG